MRLSACEYRAMDKVIALLEAADSTVFGMIAGGVLTLLGVILTARATRRSAEVGAGAQLKVAEAQRRSEESERRLRLAELLYDHRRQLVEELLIVLSEQESETAEQTKMSWDGDDAVYFHRPKGVAVVSKMRLAFPSSVTDAAYEVVHASVTHAQAHHGVDYDPDRDDDVQGHNEAHRVKTEAKYAGARDRFLATVQQEMMAADNEYS